MGGLIFLGVGMMRAKANIAKVECRASLLDMPRCSNVTKGNIALTNLVYCYGPRPKWSEHVQTSAD